MTPCHQYTTSSCSSSEDGGCLVEVKLLEHKPERGSFSRRHHHNVDNNNTAANRATRRPSSTSRRPQASSGRRLATNECVAAGHQADLPALHHHIWLLACELEQQRWAHACCVAELQRVSWLYAGEQAAHHVGWLVDQQQQQHPPWWRVVDSHALLLALLGART